MSHHPAPFLTIVACTVSAAACTSPAPPADLAITNVTVIDAARGARTHRTVVVDDGRITAILDADSTGAAGATGAAGSRGASNAPIAAETVIDGSGRYLIPGLWDFHAHLTYDDRFTEAMPALFLSWGVTSIRDTGGILDRVLPVVERMEAADAVAPRVFFAGPLLDGAEVVYDGEHRPALGIANPDPEAARANVAALAEAGVDFVKVYEMVSPEVFAAIVDEAESMGLPIDGHVPLSMLARDVGPRVQSLEHLRNIELDCAAGADSLLAERRSLLSEHDEESGAALRSRLHREQRLTAVADYDAARCNDVMTALASTTMVPTLRLNALGLASPFDRADWSEAVDRLPASVGAVWREDAERARADGGTPARDTTYGAFSLRLVGAMHAHGLHFGAGTDTPIGHAIPGYSLHNELEMLVRAGLSPVEALAAATLQPAEYFGLADELGTIEVGRLADLVLLSANPLDDIANTRTVEAVVTKGTLLDRTALSAALVR